MIYQLDAFVFKDELKYFCSLDYDYIGAAWSLIIAKEKNIFGKKIKPRVGNGGFSLRKVQSCFDLLKKYKAEIESFENKLAEDVIFSIFGTFDENFKIASVEVADKFSVEILAKRFVEKNHGNLPFGCHNWNNFSGTFWTKIFKNFGYDLTPYKNKLFDSDKDFVKMFLIKISSGRLTRRIKNQQNLSRYLLKNNFDIVIVLKSKISVEILKNFLSDDNFSCKKIFFYDSNDIDKLIQDLNFAQEKNILLITSGIEEDTLIIETAKNFGIDFENNFVFFHKEYLNYCEEIFHNLGK